ncbi:Phosphate-selective porin O and P [Allorhodopirellula solitaria]|uniref:Phosphate-selective porin O and P n=2 Tax=Allorhodopirellula solitaria TaxID=2527987 RepID=A0A5C5XWZ2_9BACT|nr:Phosphate-selective porin O and P [Allorhodopirellula solitaria]
MALLACLGGNRAFADENGLPEPVPGLFGPRFHAAMLETRPSTSVVLNEPIEAEDPDADSAESGLVESDAHSQSSDVMLSQDDMVPSEEYEKLLERVGDLESSWQKHQEKLEEESVAKKKKPTMKINGRVHLDNWNFLDSDPGVNYLESGNPAVNPQDRWDFRRLRLSFSGEVPHNMLYRIQVDFNNPNSPELKDAYLGWNNLPNNQTLLLGNQKRPIGLDHLNSSRHNLFIERPLAVEAFNEDARRLGLCMYGFTDDEMINWRYGAFLLENISNDGRYRGDSTEAGLYGRLAASPWYDETSGGRGYWHCAVAGSANHTDGDGTIDTDSNHNEARFRTRPEARSSSRWWDTGRILGAEGYQQLAFESMLNIGAFQLTGEYINTWMQRDPLGGFNGSGLHFHGGYLFANYFLTGEHVPLDRVSGTIDRVKPFENFFLVERLSGGRGNGWGALSMGLRGDYLDLSDSDIRGGQGYTVTAGMNWYWTAYSKVQMNYIAGSIEDAGQGQAAGPLPAGVGGDFTILGFRYMIDF